jgi:hypothetical protein
MRNTVRADPTTVNTLTKGPTFVDPAALIENSTAHLAHGQIGRQKPF